MKEATSELNMTVVTIILIGVVVAFFYAFWPTIRNSIQNQWNTTTADQTVQPKG